ncbi:MAG TPA: xanthine dehydrogenase family protein subunit M [Gemmatirosa sp.]
MQPFDYTVAPDVDAATRAGAVPGTRFVAGGTNLVDLMKLGVEAPAHVVDVNALTVRDPSLAAITDLPDGGMRLGALARMSDTGWDARVRERYPAVSESLLLAASGQLRNMATLGGNVLQRTRCPYFRDTGTPCNKREPGSGCPSIPGHNRENAVLGTSKHCIATHPSDLAVALAAFDATLRVRTPGGTDRAIAFTEFHLTPGDHPERETVLQPGEFITAIDLPPLAAARHSTYRKVRDRASYAFALVSAAVALDVQGGTVRDARIAMGGLATKPWRARDAERALLGGPATDANFRAAAEVALKGAVPYSENAFKIEMAKRTIVRALTEVSV